MGKPNCRNVSTARELRRIRIVLSAGLALVLMVMLAVYVITPMQNTQLLLVQGFAVQSLLVLTALAFSFSRWFVPQNRSVFTMLFIGLSVSYMWLSYLLWEQVALAIPYEGVMLYAFYTIFALGIPHRQAALASSLVVLVFIALILHNHIYGVRSGINSVFLAASMCVAVYARYRLDNAVTLLRKSNKRLINQSRHDPLTNLYNRRALMDECEHLLSIARREDIEIAALMVDIDEFKKYNDAFGHIQGDEAIKVQANILKDVFKRKTDVIGRYGGEEFLVVVCGLDERDLHNQCQRVLHEWEKRAIPHSDKAHSASLSCSIGAAISSHPGHIRLDELIAQADLNLYRSKNAGRGTFEISNSVHTNVTQ